jgi:ubiquinone/menaquinone biosynthesis C-methylase UbiE
VNEDHFTQIYRRHARQYHELIAAEDVDGNLLPALQQIVSFKGQRVLDVGSGTGRIPLLLEGLECKIVAVDLYRDMLRQQDSQRKLVQGDARLLPFRRNWADVVTAGWAIGHFTGWFGEQWQRQASRALSEMARAAKPGGTLIVLETMGTGMEEAAPPGPKLAGYYAWLEAQGFERRVVSTDYEFGSVARAAEVCGFFFGAEMAQRIRERGWKRVPEFTGIWNRKG